VVSHQMTVDPGEEIRTRMWLCFLAFPKASGSQHSTADLLCEVCIWLLLAEMGESKNQMEESTSVVWEQVKMRSISNITYLPKYASWPAPISPAGNESSFSDSPLSMKKKKIPRNSQIQDINL
jgi:hypothetical protein